MTKIIALEKKPRTNHWSEYRIISASPAFDDRRQHFSIMPPPRKEFKLLQYGGGKEIPEAESRDVCMILQQ